MAVSAAPLTTLLFRSWLRGAAARPPLLRGPRGLDRRLLSPPRRTALRANNHVVLVLPGYRCATRAGEALRHPIHALSDTKEISYYLLRTLPANAFHAETGGTGVQRVRAKPSSRRPSRMRTSISSIWSASASMRRSSISPQGLN